MKLIPVLAGACLPFLALGPLALRDTKASPRETASTIETVLAAHYADRWEERRSTAIERRLLTDSLLAQEDPAASAAIAQLHGELEVLFHTPQLELTPVLDLLLQPHTRSEYESIGEEGAQLLGFALDELQRAFSRAVLEREYLLWPALTDDSAPQPDERISDDGRVLVAQSLSFNGWSAEIRILREDAGPLLGILTAMHQLLDHEGRCGPESSGPH